MRSKRSCRHRLLPTALLLLTAALMSVRPFGASYRVGPLARAVFGLLTAQIARDDAWPSLGPLRNPLLCADVDGAAGRDTRHHRYFETPLDPAHNF